MDIPHYLKLNEKFFVIYNIITDFHNEYYNDFSKIESLTKSYMINQNPNELTPILDNLDFGIIANYQLLIIRTLDFINSELAFSIDRIIDKYSFSEKTITSYKQKSLSIIYESEELFYLSPFLLSFSKWKELVNYELTIMPKEKRSNEMNKMSYILNDLKQIIKTNVIYDISKYIFDTGNGNAIYFGQANFLTKTNNINDYIDFLEGLIRKLIQSEFKKIELEYPHDTNTVKNIIKIYILQDNKMLYVLMPIFIIYIAVLVLRSRIKNERIYHYDYTQLFPFKVFLSPYVSNHSDTLVHAKLYIIDDFIAYMGSINFTVNAKKYNYEARIRISDPNALKVICEEFDELYYNSEIPFLDIEAWGKRLYKEPIN